jgi:signal transduction histidine kinase
MPATHANRGERRVRAVELRDNVLAIVAHDLRTPLSTIIMAAELLGEVHDAEQAKHFREIIMSAARQADYLIHDLVDVTRIENLGLHVQCSSEPAAYLVTSVVEQFEQSSALAGVLLAFDVSRAGHAEVMVDSARFVQLLSNLISNAIKFTPPGGNIRVTAEAQSDHVLISVHDDGIGISPDELPHVFERFWQANYHRRAGAGLGLAIAKGIVDAHHGQIGVKSELGKGSLFYFTLPRSDGDPPLAT